MKSNFFIILVPRSSNCLELFSQSVTVNQAHLFCFMLLEGWDLLTSLHDPVTLVHSTSSTDDLLRFRGKLYFNIFKEQMSLKTQMFYPYFSTLQTILIIFKIKLHFIIILEPQAVTTYLFLHAAFSPEALHKTFILSK